MLRVSAATASYLVVNENFNAGWRAVIDRRQLRAVRLDGWKQGWLLPAGTSGLVHLTYQPAPLYRAAVVGGLAAVVLVLLVAVWPWPVPLPRRSRPARPPRGVRAPRVRRFARMASPALVLSGLVVTGLWLGGYPGAVIVPAATCLFLASNADFLVLADGRSALGRLWRPRVLAGLLLAASICGAAGEHLQQAGNSGLVVAALLSGVPQIIGLIIVGRLAAALILSLPGPACANAAQAGGVPASPAAAAVAANP